MQIGILLKKHVWPKPETQQKNRNERMIILFTHQRKAKTTMSCYFIPVLSGTLRKSDLNIDCWQVSGSKGLLGKYKVVELLWKPI